MQIDRRPRADRPRTNKRPEELERKRALLHEQHVEPLARYVARIRADRGIDRVPDFDPTEAGVNARMLLLAEAPGPKATRERGGSGFVSPDNNDGSAENMWHALRGAGINRASAVVTWNIVPWYIGSDTKIRPAESDDVIAARPYVEELIGLCPDLAVVVLLGKWAQRGWARLGLGLPSIEAPHPSPQNLNTRPHLRVDLVNALGLAGNLAGG